MMKTDRTVSRVVGVGVDHVVEIGDLAVLVPDEREVERSALGLLDVAGPLAMGADVVDGQADQLGIALVELRLAGREGSELGGAHRGEVLGVGEEDAPAVPEELVEVDGALGGLGGEVGSGVPESDCHVMLLFAVVGGRYCAGGVGWGRRTLAGLAPAPSPGQVSGQPGQ